MKTPKTKLFSRAAAGALVAVGVALAAASPAMADSWKHHGNGNGHWKHHGGGYYSQGYYYQPRPQVVYVQPAPVYVQPAPVYVAPPPPPPVYYQPAPVYYEPRPSLSIVLPIHID